MLEIGNRMPDFQRLTRMATLSSLLTLLEKDGGVLLSEGQYAGLHC